MRVAVAGTFGPLHDGHRALLRAALELGDDGVVVALTSDELAGAERTRSVPPYDRRADDVRAEIADMDEWGRDVSVRRLADEHGIATEDPSIDALVVSPETVPEVETINDVRRERGMDPIRAVVVPYVYADDGERISSTRIVRGEIDEHGNVRK
ncbi:phosphopantetheine adenylyltransferase [Halopelagius longus]|uniref:Phosphopantetheine adenylyltransferase n=1 Tax=Halopelagius longus TaxID=1236180 RepID=A0A1H1FGF9_9EURY|nr:phosphopantetheine adenylyltransferase [Halopelagius longus]RDI70109.1 phosphopantetheine adenylyltransferase [Halopelagius longus]SDR00112.1 pantetheine-phosphate adenylyltransferase [Halopelagius longus]